VRQKFLIWDFKTGSWETAALRDRGVVRGSGDPPHFGGRALDGVLAYYCP